MLDMLSLFGCELTRIEEKLNQRMIRSSDSKKPLGRPYDLLHRVQKPARYLGHEINRVIKNPSEVKLRMALAFPDVYDVGMSHLGLKILYAVVNARPDLYGERVFAPWPDMEALLRSEGRPLLTLETATPLSEMDFVGFSLQYELCATTVLQMLELGGITLRAEDRTTDDPFVVGGGPAAFNPVPLSPFFDAFVIGDGEEVILELADLQVRWKREGGSREDLLREWKGLTGVLVPSLQRDSDVVTKRVVADLSSAVFPTRPVVPFCETVHDRIGLEITRGCTRGCRFCQAGMIYRPVRERTPAQVMSLARESIRTTGWEEISLLSLSSGDYTCIRGLMTAMAREFAPEKVALSLPSLRTDTFDSVLAEQIRKVRKTGFTLAPEAGTDRLRRIINKGSSEQDLERAVIEAFRHGWQSVKLYFMIGLPFETDEDLNGIIGLVRKVSHWTGGGRATASISTFVPKSHTPFQWAGQISLEETRRRQQHIRRFFTKGRTRVKFHDPRVSFLEGVLARGDQRVAEVIISAYSKGARFDGWDDRLAFDLWMRAFEDCDLNPELYLAGKDPGEALPWDGIDAGVSRQFLVEEWEKAKAEETTVDCRSGACSACGVCDFDEIRTRLADADASEVIASPAEEPPAGEAEIRRFRLRYAKVGHMALLGHQDLIRLFHRAFRRAGLKLDYSKGFHPHPRLRFSPPLGVGIESTAEYVDFDLLECALSTEQIVELLGTVLPSGIMPLILDETALKEAALSGRIRQVTYEVIPASSLSSMDLAECIRRFQSCSQLEITRVHKGKTKTRDLKIWIEDLTISGSVLHMTLRAGPDGSVHPVEAARAVLGLGNDAAHAIRVYKTSVRFEETDEVNEGFSHVE
jgi:radical SAM family uncharacterized protein/radical SAM-linked protein